MKNVCVCGHPESSHNVYVDQSGKIITGRCDGIVSATTGMLQSVLTCDCKAMTYDVELEQAIIV